MHGAPPHHRKWPRGGGRDDRGAIRAAKAVVLACGAIQTPQLMMVSGLGPAQHLQEHGIGVVTDLPHLGQHLRDHVAAPVVWETHEPVTGWEICPFEATMMLQLEPDAPAPDILFHFGLRVREKYADGPRLATSRPAVKASPNVTRARSEGEIRLSGPAMSDTPVIDLNYFSDPSDLDLLIRALRLTRKLGETRAMKALCRAEIHPGPAVQTDEEWRDYILSVCETVYHPCGTAAIGRVVTPGPQGDGRRRTVHRRCLRLPRAHHRQHQCGGDDGGGKGRGADPAGLSTGPTAPVIWRLQPATAGSSVGPSYSPGASPC